MVLKEHNYAISLKFCKAVPFAYDNMNTSFEDTQVKSTN